MNARIHWNIADGELNGRVLSTDWPWKPAGDEHDGQAEGGRALIVHLPRAGYLWAVQLNGLCAPKQGYAFLLSEAMDAAQKSVNTPKET